MSIQIKKIGNLFEGRVSLPDTNEITWKTEALMSESELRKILIEEQGQDQRDVEEVFSISDSNFFGVGKW